MILLAYFLMMLPSANMKSDLLTVRQFCRWGTGLYRAMVRARCALACFMEAVSAAAAAAGSCASPLRSRSPSPESTVLGADSSPNRAILQRDGGWEGGRRSALESFSYTTGMWSRAEPVKRIHLQSTGSFFERPPPKKENLQILITPYPQEEEKQRIMSFSWHIF